MSVQERQTEEEVRWLALLLRQCFLMAAGEIERRYGLPRRGSQSEYRCEQQEAQKNGTG